MKEGFKISGPYPADTIFLKNNRKKYDVIVGMYHDQVLTPIKTLYEFDAINITLGLPFVRISPDHGPNQKMMLETVKPSSLVYVGFVNTGNFACEYYSKMHLGASLIDAETDIPFSRV